jgi:superfamily II DNA or RNA helicase
MNKKEKNDFQKNLLENIPTNPHGRFHLAPRIGKTKLIIDLIKRDNPSSILWVTPSSVLAETGIQEEFIKFKASKYLKKLHTITWKSLPLVFGHYDWIILDEEHLITENNSVNIGETLTYNSIISMTGTPTKTKNKEILYERLYLNNILITLNITDAVNVKILSDYLINVVKIPLSKIKDVKIEVKSKNFSFFTSSYAQYQYYDKIAEEAIFKNKNAKNTILKRMRLIYDSVEKEKVAIKLRNSLNTRKLIFCSSINQAERISPYYYHSKTSDKLLNAFLKEEINELALVNTGGTGITYKKVKDLIIIQADSDKNGSSTQKISRALLEEKNKIPTIWILCLMGTQDEIWVKEILKNFDNNKIKYIEHEEI